MNTCAMHIVLVGQESTPARTDPSPPFDHNTSFQQTQANVISRDLYTSGLYPELYPLLKGYCGHCHLPSHLPSALHPALSACWLLKLSGRGNPHTAAIKGAQRIIWKLSISTYLHGKPQPKLPQHTQNNMGWLAFCLPFYSISTRRMHVCGQLKLALWDLLSHSTLKTKAAGSSVEINLTWLATCLMQQPRLSWQPAAKPTKNCTAKSQAPQKNIFNTFNHEI